jgi:hypothetical protein
MSLKQLGGSVKNMPIHDPDCHSMTEFKTIYAPEDVFTEIKRVLMTIPGIDKESILPNKETWTLTFKIQRTPGKA